MPSPWRIRARLWSQGVRRCYRCGEPIAHRSEATLEHIIPKVAGGTNDPANLSLSHEACNRQHGWDCAGLRRYDGAGQGWAGGWSG